MNLLPECLEAMSYKFHFLKDCLETSGNGKEETCYELENGVGSENLGKLTGDITLGELEPESLGKQ